MPRLHNIDSFYEVEKNINNNYKNLGYKYEGNIMKNVLSNEMFGNAANDVPIRLLERIVEFLVNQVKRIKLEYNFTLPKNSTNLN